MDQETLFTSSKWDVLQALSKGQKSPLQLARDTKTSIANISQQLRLLELANIVKSERVPNRERGEPRLLYSLLGPLSYIIASAPGFVEKKRIPLDKINEIILKIMFVKEQQAHYYLQKYFWKIEEYLHDIDAIAVKTEFGKIKIAIVSNDQKVKSELKSTEIRKGKGESQKIEVTVGNKEDILKKIVVRVDGVKDYTVIYDPSLIFAGGEKNET